MLIIIGLAIVLLVFIAFMAGKANDEAAEKALNEFSSIPGFYPGMTETIAAGKPSLSIDSTTKQFAIMIPGRSVKSYKFDQLVAVDVQRDGRSLTKTNRGSQVAGAAVGAVLLGPAGLLLGGLTGSKRTEEKVKAITLRIHLNDMASPVVDIHFFKDFVGQKADGMIIKHAAQRADRWHSRFLAIMHDQALSNAA